MQWKKNLLYQHIYSIWKDTSKSFVYELCEKIDISSFAKKKLSLQSILKFIESILICWNIQSKLKQIAPLQRVKNDKINRNMLEFPFISK